MRFKAELIWQYVGLFVPGRQILMLNDPLLSIVNVGLARGSSIEFKDTGAPTTCMCIEPCCVSDGL